MSPFDLDRLKGEKEELENGMSAPNFWDDVENANKVNQRIKAISNKIDKYEKLALRGEDLETLIEMAEEEGYRLPPYILAISVMMLHPHF